MKNINVLIVEDEAIVALDLENKLEENGYHVLGTVDSYEEAVNFLDLEKPDVVLMDIMIKGTKTGIDLARKINEKNEMPVIFLTANNDDKVIKEIASTKPYGFITKPFDLREVISTIEIARHKFLYELSLLENEKKLQAINEELDQRVKERTSELMIINGYLNEEINLRNEIEKSLVNSEKLYKDTIKNLGSGLAIVAPMGTVVTVNEALCTMLGYSKINLEGNSIAAILNVEYWHQILDHFKNNYTNFNLPEIRLKKANEDKLWCNLFLSVIITREGDEYYLFSIIDIDQQKKGEQLLHKERKRRTQSIIEGEEKERKRIALELHDGLGQRLTAAKLTLGALIQSNRMDKEDRQLILETKKMIEETMQEVREISNNLNSSVLADFGLEAALTNMCDEIDSKTTTQVTCESHIKDKRLKAEKESALFRIAQESINNALKYAEAAHIHVTLQEIELNIIQLEIMDDGKGFDLTEQLKGNGNGLFNMRERCSSVKAHLDIETAYGQGTMIRVQLPV